VVSPGDTYTEVEDKVIEWLNAGTRMVVVINPVTRSVSVYRGLKATLLTENDVLSGQDVVPGWSVPVKDLFA
jgi:Uma2 family endonuclease